MHNNDSVRSIYIIDRARELWDLSDEVSAQEFNNGLVELTSKVLGIDTDEAYRMIVEEPKATYDLADEVTRQALESAPNQIVLIAFQMGEKTQKDAQLSLFQDIKHLPEDPSSDVIAYWVAMDERYEASDNDSAEFIQGSGVAALKRFRALELTELVSIQGFQLASEEEGLEVICEMNRIMRTYSYATVADMLELLGESRHGTYVSSRLAWTTPLPEACVRGNDEEGWRLDIPTPDAVR